jgi:hypothetical protein
LETETQLQTANPLAQPTNSLAIASLMSSLLWFGGMGSTLAIILGHKARKEIATTGQAGDGMATAGITIGWIGVAITAIMILVVTSFFSTTRAEFEEVGGPAIFSGELEDTGIRMNMNSALKDAAAAQQRYFAEHGRYTDDIWVLTEEGFWEDVVLTPFRADDRGYCIQAESRGMPVRHITEASPKTKKGPCSS